MIAHAETVLSWQENLLPNEMPPEWMWPFDDELEGWFTEVERSRNDRYGITPDEEDDGSGVDNELVKGLR